MTDNQSEDIAFEYLKPASKTACPMCGAESYYGTGLNDGSVKCAMCDFLYKF
jgi:uncharacterized protein (DUF427 family)